MNPSAFPRAGATKSALPSNSKIGSRCRRLLLGFASAALFPWASNASAETLFTFSTLRADPPMPQRYAPAFVTVSLAAQVTGPSTAEEIGTSAVNLARFWNTEWAGFSVAGGSTAASTPDDWLTRGAFVFTLTAAPGHFLNLDSFDFLGARGGAAGTRGFEIYASIDGVENFDTDLVISVPDMDPTYTRANPHPYALDLSGERYQGIDSVTFRYVPLTSSTQSADFNGFTMEGSVLVIPEPGTLALLGLAVVGCAFAHGIRCRRARN